MEEWLIDFVKKTFESMYGEIQEVVNIITRDPQTTGTLWETVNKIYDLVLPVGLTLATLFFFIDFLKKSIMLDYVKWENVVKCLFKLLVCKLVMENCMWLLEIITTAFNGLVHQVGTLVTSSDNMSNLIDLQPIYDHIKTLGFSAKLGYAIELIPLGLIVTLAKYIILAIAYGRIIQLCVYTALAPLPLSTLAGETTSEIAKGFFSKYAAVCLQGALILVCCILYTGLLQFIFSGGTGGNSLMGVVVSTIVLAFMVIKSGSLAKDLCSR